MLHMLRTLKKKVGIWTCPSCKTVIQWKIKPVVRVLPEKKEKTPDFSKTLF